MKQDTGWVDILPTRGNRGTQLNWSFMDASDGCWRGPRLDSIFLDGFPRRPTDYTDEEYKFGDQYGPFGQGPVNIGEIVGRLSRTTNKNLLGCIASGDCWKQIVEKEGYFGIWPIDGHDESWYSTIPAVPRTPPVRRILTMGISMRCQIGSWRRRFRRQ